MYRPLVMVELNEKLPYRKVSAWIYWNRFECILARKTWSLREYVAELFDNFKYNFVLINFSFILQLARVLLYDFIMLIKYIIISIHTHTRCMFYRISISLNCSSDYMNFWYGRTYKWKRFELCNMVWKLFRVFFYCVLSKFKTWYEAHEQWINLVPSFRTTNPKDEWIVSTSTSYLLLL